MMSMVVAMGLLVLACLPFFLIERGERREKAIRRGPVLPHLR